MEENVVLNCIDHSTSLEKIPFDHSGVQEELKRAGFWHIAQIEYIRLDRPLITALCDRWRPETSTFHFKVGEMTVSLQDVSVLLGLNIDGLAVHYVMLDDYDSLFHELLGVWPPSNAKHSTMHINMTWFRDTFSKPLPLEATEVEVKQRTRAVILHFISCRLLVDHSKGRMCLKFLPLIRDLEMCSRYSWGSAVLCMLYKELSDAALMKSNSIAGCLTLLQLWSWTHLSVGRPNRSITDINAEQPYGCWWNGIKNWDETPNRNVQFYRDELDLLENDSVDWVAYGSMLELPRVCTVGYQTWTSKTPIICFNNVQMHSPDRVMRQFGYRQHLPDPFLLIGMSNTHTKASDNRIARYIEIWRERHMHIQRERHPTISLDEYIRWYWHITRRHVLKKSSRKLWAFTPRAPLERGMVGTMYKVLEGIEYIKQRREDPEIIGSTCSNLISIINAELERNNLSWPQEQHNLGPSQPLMIQNEPINSQSSTAQNESETSQNLANEHAVYPRKKPKRNTSLEQ